MVLACVFMVLSMVGLFVHGVVYGFGLMVPGCFPRSVPLAPRCYSMVSRVAVPLSPRAIRPSVPPVFTGCSMVSRLACSLPVPLLFK